MATVLMDECLSAVAVADLLRQLGHQPILVKDLDMVGASDEELCELVRNKGWTFITLNYWDFEDVHRYSPKGTGGLIVIKGKSGISRTCAILQRLLSEVVIEQLKDKTVVAKGEGFYVKEPGLGITCRKAFKPPIPV